MRVLLNKEFQRKLFYGLKGSKPWADLSKKLNTKIHILKGYALRGNTMPKFLYDKIKTNETDKFLIKFLDDSWGKTKGGKNSTGSTKTINKPKLDKNLAEIVGIVLGDGSIYANQTKGVYQVRVTGNINNEQKYISEYVKPLFESLFGVFGKIILKPEYGAVYLTFSSKELVLFFDRIGVYTSIKKKASGIPSWIKKEEEFSVACIRGLVDTDGSVYRLSKKDPHLKRISFKNTNKTLLEDFRMCLIKLDFHPSKVIFNNVFLTRKNDIKRFADKIGFSNYKNVERFAKISPVV